MPDVCPHCGGRHIAESHTDTQYQTEIPRRPIHRQFDIHIGQCQDCGGRVQGRHELQTSDALGAAASLLGLDWSGTLIHDGWSVYDRFQGAFHQQCLAHLQRRCERIVTTATGAAVRFPRAVLELIDEGFALRRAWRGHRLSGDDLAGQGLGLAVALEELASGDFTYEPNRRLAAHIRNHAMHWFWFLIDPAIDATNYRAEQAMRPAVVNRKVWGGNRTWIGARAQGVLLSLSRTLFQRGQDVLEWFSRLRRSPSPLLLPAATR